MSRIFISAVHKSSGKTTISLGIAAALKRQGLKVQTFKKGPDYIDPMWLGRASGRPCFNLDFNTMDSEELRCDFRSKSQDADIAIIEGNMGLFDSLDVEGSQSNAALARLMDSPVILVIDVKGATRSFVPVILGFQAFEPELNLAGLILNNVAGKRHEQRLREVIAHYCDIPVVGAIHRDEALHIDERHLGLIPSNEEHEANRILNTIEERIARQVDLEQFRAIADSVPKIACDESALPIIPPPNKGATVHIGVARDAAFGFYYQCDLDALQRAGAQLHYFDTLQDTQLPPVDALFIGGGFPETQMQALAANSAMRTAIRQAVEAGMPCYAECGGLMYLTRRIVWQDSQAEMVGIIPADTHMHDKPVGRGYIRMEATGQHPWPFEADSEQGLPAHEFHYSTLENIDPGLQFAYHIKRGTGIDGSHDGIVYKNLLAGYAHMKNTRTTPWAHHFIAFVRRHKQQKAQPQHSLTN